jgi:PhnB protein
MPSPFVEIACLPTLLSCAGRQLCLMTESGSSTSKERIMTTRLNPYLSFRDTARQAMEFYRSVFGGELTLSTFGEFQASADPAEQDKIMHSMLITDNGLALMASDTPNTMEYAVGTNYSVSLSGEDDAELRGYWDKLSAGGTVTMPLNQAPWGDAFGMCADKFGVSWLVNIAGKQSA